MISQKGFTLVELLIVIVIIGILAMFAIPQFQNRTISSQVTRVVMETSQLRSAMDMCALQGDTNENCDLGWTKSNLIEDEGGQPSEGIKTNQSGLLATLERNGSAKIQATFGQDAATALNDKKITWSRDANGSWTCSTDVDDKHLPKGCTNIGANKTPATTE